MGLNEVKKEILEAARKDAENILKQGREEEKKLLKDAEHSIKLLDDKQKKELAQLKEDIERKELSTAKSESKAIVMAVKKEMIEKVFEQVKKEISMLDDNERSEIIKKLLMIAKQELQVKYIYCRSQDLKFIPNDLVALEKPILGGIIVENTDKTIKMNLSFDTMLEELRQANMQELNTILFENAKA